MVPYISNSGPKAARLTAVGSLQRLTPVLKVRAGVDNHHGGAAEENHKLPGGYTALYVAMWYLGHEGKQLLNTPTIYLCRPMWI